MGNRQEIEEENRMPPIALTARFTRHPFIYVLCAVALMLTLQGCGWQSDKPITIASHVWPGYETMFLAQREGRLDPKLVNLTETASATDSLQALAEGRVDGAALTLDEVLRARAKGIPLSVVMVFDVSAGADVVLARPSIKNLAHLKGKRIGYEQGALGALMLAEVLQAAGLKKEEIQLISLPMVKQTEAWAAGQVDALITYEPIYRQLMDQGAVKLFDSSQIPDTIIDVLAIRSDVLDATHSRAIRHLISTHFSERQHILHNPHDSAFRMADHLKLPASEVMTSFKGLLLPDAVNNHRMLTGSPAPLLESARKLSALMIQEKILTREDALDALVRADFLPAIQQ
jgi:NitT/TauT family transport system substrate-binding protein